MPIPFLSRELPNLAIVDWCLIASQEVSIGEYVMMSSSGSRWRTKTTINTLGSERSVNGAI